MNRIAFRLPDDGVWTGGVNYLETVCRALLAHSDLGYEPVVFCNPDGDPKLLARFEALIGNRLIRDPAAAGRRRAGIIGALALGRNRPALALCRRHGFDVIMEAADSWVAISGGLSGVGARFPGSAFAESIFTLELVAKTHGFALAIGQQAHDFAQQ